MGAAWPLSAVRVSANNAANRLSCRPRLTDRLLSGLALRFSGPCRQSLLLLCLHSWGWSLTLYTAVWGWSLYTPTCGWSLYPVHCYLWLVTVHCTLLSVAGHCTVYTAVCGWSQCSVHCCLWLVTVRYTLLSVAGHCTLLSVAGHCTLYSAVCGWSLYAIHCYLGLVTAEVTALNWSLPTTGHCPKTRITAQDRLTRVCCGCVGGLQLWLHQCGVYSHRSRVCSRPCFRWWSVLLSGGPCFRWWSVRQIIDTTAPRVQTP